MNKLATNLVILSLTFAGSFAKAECSSSAESLLVANMSSISSKIKNDYSAVKEVSMYKDEAQTGKLYVKCREVAADEKDIVILDAFLTVKSATSFDSLKAASEKLESNIKKGVSPYSIKVEIKPEVVRDSDFSVKSVNTQVLFTGTGRYQIQLNTKTHEVLKLVRVFAE